ncbi:MAG: hypothetical protein D6696_01240 [Acidobacteria bacterium]|nr:MAG: hypothetical protein D6696_01240 [Acidobacteriota bacterium]
MEIEQRLWSEREGWGPRAEPIAPAVDLAFVFGSRRLLEDAALRREVRRLCPDAHLFGCSTAGEIHDVKVTDDTLVVTAVRLAASRLRTACVELAHAGDSLAAGRRIAAELAARDLRLIFLLSDGLHVNGSELVRGLNQSQPPEVMVSGGLAGDGERFEHTVILWQEEMREGAVGAVGFYGPALRVGCGSLGGWDPFGPERLITRSAGNVLYELDGQSALGLYKRYLGEQAAGLPATALLFPLSLRTPEGDTRVVRTIISCDEDEQSMTFAGDVPEGSYARLMKANFDRLIDGAHGAAEASCEALGASDPELALLISCVGRKMVLKQRIEEEVEGVREVVGPGTVLAGFYSYGELSPFTPSASCELHNQTMTITTLRETV